MDCKYFMGKDKTCNITGYRGIVYTARDMENLCDKFEDINEIKRCSQCFHVRPRHDVCAAGYYQSWTDKRNFAWASACKHYELKDCYNCGYDDCIGCHNYSSWTKLNNRKTSSQRDSCENTYIDEMNRKRFEKE